MKSLISFFIKHKYVVLIFCIAFFIRVYNLGSFPFNFHEDEILVGYVGRYILENGFDIYRNEWPLLYFNKFGDYYIIGPMYLSAIATFIFGINEFAVRFPAAFVGSLVVFPVFFLSSWTFKNKKIGFIAAILISLLPWHIILSRSSVEGIIGSTLFLSAITLVLYAIRMNQFKFVIFASILIFITYWIYHPFRMYAPFVFVPLFILYPSIRKRRDIFWGMILLVVFFIGLTVYISNTEWGKGRLMQTSIFSDLSGVSIRTQQQLYNSNMDNVFIARVFNNKLIGYSREYLHQYFSYFSPNFLFLKGGAESRYDMPDHGLMYISYFVLLVVSFISIGKKIETDNKLLRYLGFLILLAPIPASFTYYGSPNIHRSVLLGALLVIFAAAGLYKLYKTNKLISLSLCLFLCIEIVYFYHQYTVQSEVYNAKRRNNGYRETVTYVMQNKDKYETIYIPAEGTMALYYLFFAKDFNSKYAELFQIDACIDSVDNIKFEREPCITELVSMDSKVNSLIINKPECANASDKFTKIDEIIGRDKINNFKVYTIK